MWITRRYRDKLPAHGPAVLARSRRRWWQIALRCAAILALLAAAGYVTLPWWVPAQYLRRRLETGLSSRLGVAVTMEGLSLDWSRGVEVTGLAVASPDRENPQPMLRVERIRAELAPLKFLLYRRVGWLEVLKPQLSLRLDGSGTINPLLTGQPAVLEFQRISLSQGRIELSIPQRDKPLALRVAGLEFLNSSPAGQGGLTMVAAMEQKGGESPVTVRLATTSGREVVALATLNFSNLDLGELNLEKLLGLPLRRLAGVCSGSLDARVNRRGMVEELSLNLAAAGLDAQPREGPDLPVVEKAELGVTASFDPFAGLVNVRDLRLRMPGAELAGAAEITVDLYEGRLETLRSLDIRGKLEPASLTALLAGRRAWMPLEVEGPLDVRLASRCDDVRIGLEMQVQSTAATLRRSGQLLKPAGTRMELDVLGAMDRRSWDFAAEQAGLTLGDNYFSGKGTIQDIRRMVEGQPSAGTVEAFRAVLGNLARLEGSGSWQIRELESLRGFCPGLAGVDLRGGLNGKWVIRRQDGPGIQISVDVPAETHLAAGKLAKPDGTGVNLSVSASIEPQNAVFSGLAANLAVGKGRCVIDSGVIGFPQGSDEPQFSGRLELENTESLLDALPGRTLPVEISGNAGGDFKVAWGDKPVASLQADMTSLAVRCRDVFFKPAGKRANLAVDFHPEQDTQRTVVDFTADLDAGLLAGRLEQGDSNGETWRMKTRAEAMNASLVLGLSPWLQRRVHPARLDGLVAMTVEATFGQKQWAGTLSLDATGVDYASSGPVMRAKPAAVPLKLDLRANSIAQSGQTTVSLEDCTLDLAESRAKLSGQAILPGEGTPGMMSLVDEGAGFQCDLDTTLAVGEPLLAMVPELSGPATRHGITGQLAIHVAADGNKDTISVQSRIDAGNLAFTAVAPALQAATQPADWVAMAKPAGLPAEFTLDATVAGDLSRLDLGSLEARIGALEARGEGVIKLDVGSGRLPRDILASQGRLTLGAKQAGELGNLLPWLKPYQLSGSVFVDASWDGLSPRVGMARLRFDQFKGRYREKDVQVHGQLTLEDLNRGGDGDLRIGRISTDGLEFRAATSHGWLLADLANLPDNPTGRFDLLAEYIDDKELADWLAPAQAGVSSPATAQQRSRALQKANDLLVWLRPHLLASKLQGRVTVDRYKTFDPSVDQYYQANFVSLEASLERGLLTARTFASVNGGSLVGTHRIDLAEESPQVVSSSQTRDVIASESIQPQLAKFFPGNTVYGIFNRTEDSRSPLNELLARLIDPRYPVYPVGEAKTLTLDGLLKGNAMPDFVARAFPGLNLTQYRYKKMTGFARLRPDGTTVNDMVFSGQTYDIYIEGTTDRDNIGRYEIGLILLGTPQSAEWNHAYRLGRVPLLNFKARIEGGQMHDEKVTFVYPNESLFAIFLKNNLFYRVWLEARKP